MKKFVFAFCALIFAATAGFGQELSQAHRDKGVSYLEKTRDGVVASVKGLSAAQMNFKSGPDRWSVAQVLEHIALAEDFILEHVTNDVMKAPAGAADRDPAKTDAGVIATVPDRSHPLKAPEPLVPTGRWTPDESLKHFLASREKTIEFLKTTPDLRAHVAAGPTGAPLDGYEWILLIAGHSERHTKQIEEVKADPNFPKK